MALSTWSFGVQAAEAAYATMRDGNTALDAVVAGASVVERDSAVDSVGRGGTPDADGRMTLDACVMTAPDRCGAVAAVEGYVDVTAIARQVMERTPHVLLAGRGAAEFAARAGFVPKEVLTAEAQRRWRAWRERCAREYVDPYAGWLPGVNAEESGPKPGGDTNHDTVCVLARDARGELAGSCSTSGIAFKVPGRVGDSPIVGHGLYVDPKVGAATATGDGELIMGVCGSFMAVELMRAGSSPAEACQKVIERVAEQFEVEPRRQVAVVALAAGAEGAWSSAALRPSYVQVATDEHGTRTESPTFVRFP